MARYRTIFVGVAASLATVAVLTYWVMNHSAVDQGMKWNLFGVHLLATSTGLIIGMYGVLNGWWLSVVPALVCAALFYLQVLS